MATILAPVQPTSATVTPFLRSVWPARWGLTIAMVGVMAFSGLLFVPGIATLLAPLLGSVGNATPLAMGGAFLALMMLFALFIGWRNPYFSPPLPSTQRITTTFSDVGGLDPVRILEKEFDYAAGATEQAQEHRMTIVNFYLLVAGGAGSGVVALISSQAPLAVAAAPLLWIVAFIGGLFLLQLIALRRAWAGSVMEMNYIKEFFVVNASTFAHEDLKKAFLWNPSSIPETHRRGNVFHYSAILIALLDSGAFLGGIFTLGLSQHATITAPGSSIVAFALAFVCFQTHMWLFAIMLIPFTPKKPAPSQATTGAKSTSYTPQPPSHPNTVIGSREIFAGKLLKLRVDDVRLPSGKEEVRELVQKGPAVVIVPYLESTNEFLCIEQFRDAVATSLWELPAGYVNAQEDHAVAARRELLEETGYEAGSLCYLGSFFTSPGWTNEQLHLYVATHLHYVSGIQDTDEVQNLHRIPRSEVMSMITHGKITDAKSILGLLWGDRTLPTEI